MTISNAFKSGVLGINARNLLYIRPFNRKRAIKLADNKLKTKLLLAGRGIPVPSLLGVIRSRADLEQFDWQSMKQPFVVKPNRGFGGEGILVTKRIRDRWYDVDGNPLTQEILESHVQSILDGRWSLANVPDIAIIEGKILPPPFFRTIAPVGLPDIRVIVFNLVPVIAMLRLPTARSSGKANWHQGGVMVGLDLSTGQGTYAYSVEGYLEKIPGTDVNVRDIRVPHWDRILLTASRAQRITNLGYLAIDFTLNKKSNPLVLEINARGGLSIQLANRVALRTRLERVGGLKVKNAEHGLRIAKELFGEQIEREIERISGKEVIGRIEPVTLKRKGQRLDLFARIDPGKLHTSVDLTVARNLGLVPEDFAVASKRAQGDEKLVKLRYTLGTKLIRTEASVRDYAKSRYKLLIGSRDLVPFLIDPLKSAERREEFLVPTPLPALRGPERDLHEVDELLGDIDERIRLISHLKPLNLEEEKEKFLVDPSYNPRFLYRPLDFNPFKLRRSLAELSFGPGPLDRIFEQKREELLLKLDLLLAVGKDSFTEFSKRLYPLGDAGFQAEARARTFSKPDTAKTDDLLSTEEVVVEFERVLRLYDLPWTVKVMRSLASDFAVSKNKSIFVRRGIRASKRRLLGSIAHEIETHVLTAENGKLQPYRIFQYGFGNFLETQEGLADYMKLRTVGRDDESLHWGAFQYRSVLDGMELPFAKLAEKVRADGMSLRQSFSIAKRVKRGLADTSRPGAFTKDCSYFLGLHLIEDYFAGGGDIRDLFVGKVNVQQIPLVRQIPGIVPPRYIPKILQAIDPRPGTGTIVPAA